MTGPSRDLTWAEVVVVVILMIHMLVVDGGMTWMQVVEGDFSVDGDFRVVMMVIWGQVVVIGRACLAAGTVMSISVLSAVGMC